MAFSKLAALLALAVSGHAQTAAQTRLDDSGGSIARSNLDAARAQSSRSGDATAGEATDREIELTRLLRERQQEPLVFRSAMRVLEALEEDDPLQPALRRFELELLDQLGYGIDFSVDGEGLRDSAFYWFEPQVGFHLVNLDTGSVRSVSGKVLQAIARRDFADSAVLDAAKLLMRSAIEPLLGDKPLTSRKLFQP